ncbi:MAG TPA: NAD(P)-binding domain-containing protein [Candidatus Dormibacteraeota bacterium]|nr:NAD(P)-binding domain-containing protein [Candidatus Dormibacteraeota bacterium]
MAEVTPPPGGESPAGVERPFPPGKYPVIVVGSGPGGLQLSYCLTRLGIGHAVLSRDPAPGGMFRRFPFFQRLLSWTKAYAPAERGTRAYERYDWNSLLAEEAADQAVMVDLMDGTSEFPSRPEMEAGLLEFASRTGIRVRYDCEWLGTGREEGPDGERFVVETSDGPYRCRLLVLAVGVAQAWKPDTPGMELVPHYVDTRAAESYAGKRLFIVGKQNSGFELANGLLSYARRIVLASPRPARTSIETNSLVGIRARYVQPVEDHIMASGVHILSASIERVERRGDAFTVHTRTTDGGLALAVEADEVIAATGFTTPLLDLPGLGVATSGQSRLPAQTDFWESATLPGVYFAGTITQGAKGPQKYGIPSNSGAVHGHRYNGRILARHIAERHFGAQLPRRAIAPADLVAHLADEATNAPELWNQKGYLASVVLRGADGGWHDEGILPLAHFADAGGPDGIGVIVEGDPQGVIRPAIYVRRAGNVEEVLLDPHPLHDFASRDHRHALERLVAERFA